MSAPEGAEAPSEDVDDPEAEDDEPTIPLVAISAATIKRHVALLLERLIKKAADSELFPHKPTAGTNSLRSQEKSDTAAAGSLIGLVHEILLGERWHLSGRQVWNIMREMIPQTEEEHWKTGAKTFLINMRVEKRQFAVKDILTELVEKEPGMAAALTDFGTTDDEHHACTRRVCTILDGFHASTLVLGSAPNKSKRKAKAGGAAGGSASSNPPPTPRTPAKVALRSGVEELAAYQRSQVHSAAQLLSKNASPIMQSQNYSPTSRKRFRDALGEVSAALVAEIPLERPEGLLGPNALALLQYITSTGAKTMKADAARVKLQQRSLFPGAADDEERQGEEEADADLEG